MPANESKKEKDKYYSKLLIYTRLRFFLWVMILGVGTVFTLFLYNVIGDRSWLVAVPPVVALGTLLALFPAIEEWEYKPWQVSPQQYERHMID